MMNAAKVKSARVVPVLVSFASITLACLLYLMPLLFPSLDLFQRLEWMTYDWRVRQAMQHETPVSTNLAAVFIDDDSLRLINAGMSFNWPWPRQLHGRLVNQLARKEAQAIAFDILFDQLHSPSSETDVQMQNGGRMASDEYFSAQLRRAGNVVLAAFGDSYANQWRAIVPADPFRTNAWMLGHATSEMDTDGVLRRARAYRDDPKFGRIWHLGITMAAKNLGLDLTMSEIKPDRIVFHGTNRVERILPVDEQGFFYVNWCLAWNDKRITKGSFEEAAGLLKSPDASLSPNWTNKLVFVGSIGSGNNITDFGTTPLARDTYLISKHWNVANSLITGQFIHTVPTRFGLMVITGMGILSLALSWRLKAPWPSLLVFLIAIIYVAGALFLFVRYRLWLPVVMPVLGGLLLTHVALIVCQVLYEQKEKRHVKAVFDKLVSPDVVNELLQAETLNLGGAHRNITVMFSDVRGFTEMTDVHQNRAEGYVLEHGLTGPEAEAYKNNEAGQVLATVNVYLAAIADQVKKHKGTLDKYIGDCVMAFWGAPIINEHHAVNCVQAAIDAQWRIFELNASRAAENKRREEKNQQLLSNNEEPIPMLPLLSLGTGINTGSAIVGLMGSEDHILNYTVFGREVNLASRLETVSGRGRIIIGEATFQDLKRFAPEMAKTCIELPPVNVKGIRTEIKIYEVPWKNAKLDGPLKKNG